MGMESPICGVMWEMDGRTRWREIGGWEVGEEASVTGQEEKMKPQLGPWGFKWRFLPYRSLSSSNQDFAFSPTSQAV